VHDAAGTGNADLAVLNTLRLESVSGATAYVEADSPQSLSFAVLRAEWLNSLLTRVAGRPVKVALSARKAPAGAPQPSPASPHDHPLVKQARELLGARLIRVEDDPPR
jgi:hypothetical protein